MKKRIIVLILGLSISISGVPSIAFGQNQNSIEGNKTVVSTVYENASENMEDNIIMYNGEKYELVFEELDDISRESEIKINLERTKAKTKSMKFNTMLAKSFVEENTSDIQDKLEGKIKEIYTNKNPDEKFDVLINTFHKVSDLEEKLIQVLNDDKIEKIDSTTYKASLKKEEVEIILNKIPEIDYIVLEDEVKGTLEIQDSEITDIKSLTGISASKASSEILEEVEDARRDFNVTGDRDGNESSYSKNDVVIAVIDTGIDADHKEFDKGKVIAWYDAVDDEKKPLDEQGHGTKMSTIAAGNNYGHAPGAALVGVRVLKSDRGDLGDMLKGLKWLWKNKDVYDIDVVNISLGHEPKRYPIGDYTMNLVVDYINKFNNDGIPVMVAAGNEGDESPYYDTLTTEAKYTTYPVGAGVDPFAGGWSPTKYSSRGKGSRGPRFIASAEPHKVAKAGTSTYTYGNGSSSATAAASGTLALMIDARGNSSRKLNFITKKLGPKGFDKIYGEGMLRRYDSIAESKGSSERYGDKLSVAYTKENVTEKNKFYVSKLKILDDDYLNVVCHVLNEKNLPSSQNDFFVFCWKPGKSPSDGINSEALNLNGRYTPIWYNFAYHKDDIKAGDIIYVAVHGKEDMEYLLEITGAVEPANN
ncbi:MAG: S8 family serine peptidase [Anaeromicrobium sp.]|jgi:serine protease AprX|uniref:S8 family serine peptidase n=1 Tax=Anaeromicrobium sp. TaxID=1929132 RepID=UPI0025F94F7D|nr:S8 family serine peptidase [Anaeromicrobium sp.]MCT4595241.1 S8 family serine peptidase [Anaeromicrobium sp.]